MGFSPVSARSFARLISVLGLTAAVVGCSQNPSSHYQAAVELEPLKFPEGVESNRIAELYVIPELKEEDYIALDKEWEVPRPQPFNSKTENFVKLQSLSGDTWIYTSAKPGQVWPRVQGFLQSTGIPVDQINPKAGTIDTVWLKVKGSDTLEDRYRFVVEPGIARYSAEIHIKQQSAEVVQSKGGLAWPELPDSPERANMLLKQLAGYLASAVNEGSVSLLAERIGGGAKVRLMVPESGEPHLRMRVGYDRAWATIALAMKSEAFEVIDEKDQQGIFYIEHTPPEEDKPGILSGLFSFKDERANLYQVMVRKNSSENTDVYIYDADAKPLAADKTHEMLQLIRSYLG